MNKGLRKRKKRDRKTNVWQEKQKRMGRRAFTVFLDAWIIQKIFMRANAKGMSVAEYLNRFMPAMWAKVGGAKQQLRNMVNE
jgi:hypothetical protein